MNSPLTKHFHLPLSVQAHNLFLQLSQILQNLNLSDDQDQWAYIWGSRIFSVSKAYKALIGHRQIHPIYNWIWKSRCQMKHKVFFWLLLKDRLSTRDLLQRNMVLESYTCEMCILQKRETVAHLFCRCNFARACWESIGISFIRTRTPLQIFNNIKNQLQVSFFMEIIIVMASCIWKERNDWLFQGIDPSVQSCRAHFFKEFNFVILRSSSSCSLAMQNWLNSL